MDKNKIAEALRFIADRIQSGELPEGISPLVDVGFHFCEDEIQVGKVMEVFGLHGIPKASGDTYWQDANVMTSEVRVVAYYTEEKQCLSNANV